MPPEDEFEYGVPDVEYGEQNVINQIVLWIFCPISLECRVESEQNKSTVYYSEVS